MSSQQARIESAGTRNKPTVEFLALIPFKIFEFYTEFTLKRTQVNTIVRYKGWKNFTIKLITNQHSNLPSPLVTDPLVQELEAGT